MQIHSLSEALSGDRVNIILLQYIILQILG